MNQIEKCPNDSPGRYEGESLPCIAEALDSQTEWADETAGDSSIAVHRSLFGTASDVRKLLPSDVCGKCLSRLALMEEKTPAHLALIEENGNGFVTLRWVSEPFARTLMEEADSFLSSDDEMEA